MIKKCISKNWKFTDWTSGYTDIDLPHDYSISKERSADGSGDGGNGFYSNCRGKYVKHITFDKPGHYILNLDGAYMCTQILFNENYLASHPCTTIQINWR